MADDAPDPLIPVASALNGFLVTYDADQVAPSGEVIPPVVNLMDSVVLQDPDRAPTIEVFQRDGKVHSVRVNLTGYYVIPINRVLMLTVLDP